MSLRRRLFDRIPDLRSDSAFWRRALQAGVVHGPAWFVRSSPPLFGLGFALGMPAMRERVSQNLRRAGVEPSARAVAEVFCQYAWSLTEAFAMGHGRGDRIRAVVEGDEAFRRAIAMKRGVVVLTAHTSGWYAAGPVLGEAWAIDVVAVMQRERDHAAAELQQNARATLGVKVVYVGDDPLSALPLLGQLRRGGVVAMQIDRAAPGQRTVAVPLLGEDVPLPEGPFALASLSGAPILTVMARRTGHLEYALEVGEPIVLPPRASAERLRQGALEVARRLEGFVRRHPTHWFDFRAGAQLPSEGPQAQVSPGAAMS
jgi:phosphatidylinositol dimannoside acyltransferase